jgi:hypothetical protein
MSAVHSSLVPSSAPATEYVAIPEGSSSAAPVMTPGPSDLNNDRIHRDGNNVGTRVEGAAPFRSKLEATRSCDSPRRDGQQDRAEVSMRVPFPWSRVLPDHLPAFCFAFPATSSIVPFTRS